MSSFFPNSPASPFSGASPVELHLKTDNFSENEGIALLRDENENLTTLKFRVERPWRDVFHLSSYTEVIIEKENPQGRIEKLKVYIQSDELNALQNDSITKVFFYTTGGERAPSMEKPPIKESTPPPQQQTAASAASTSSAVPPAAATSSSSTVPPAAAPEQKPAEPKLDREERVQRDVDAYRAKNYDLEHGLYTNEEEVLTSLKNRQDEADEQMKNEKEGRIVIDENTETKYQGFLRRKVEELTIHPANPADSGEIGGIPFHLATIQGRKPEQQDFSLVKEITIQLGDGKEYKAQLFGVFDGHGLRDDAAKFVAANTDSYLKANLEKFNKDGLSKLGIENALKQTYIDLDDKYFELTRTERYTYTELSGTTVNLTMVLNGQLWDANIGDTRAIKCTSGETRQISEDSKPTNPHAQKGIEKRGGKTDGRRVEPISKDTSGDIGVTRAVGDPEYPLSARCKITCHDIEFKDNESIWVLIACDGLWDVCSSKQAAEFLLKYKNEAHVKLIKGAFVSGSTDNITILTFELKPPVK